MRDTRECLNADKSMERENVVDLQLWEDEEK